jgi:signal transduction histidine kinase
MKLSIRLKLLIGFTLLLFLSTLVQGFSFIITRQYITSQIEGFQKEQVKKGASEVKQFFATLGTETSGLARVFQRDRKNLAPAANFVIDHSDSIKKITFLSPAGRELAKFNKSGQVPQEKLNYEVLSDPFYSAATGATAVSKVYYKEAGLGPHLDLYSPIFNDAQKVEAVIKMQINLNLLQNILKDIKLGEQGHIHIVDNEGRLLTHHDESYVLERPNLSSRKIISDMQTTTTPPFDNYRYVNEKGIPVVATAEKVPGYHWIAVFEQPESEAFGFLDLIRNIFAFTVVASFICLLLIALFLSENLARPIRKLQKSAKEVEKGKLDRIALVKSGDEIESLSYSFASLINQLIEREHSLRNITMQLEKANSKLKQLDALKNEFVSVASHELRTPMTAIKSYLWMALEGKGGQLNDEQKFYIQRGYNSVDRLIRLVNELLNISRIEAGKITIDMQEVDIEQLAQEVIDEVMPRAKEVGVEVTIAKHEAVANVLADPDKLKEVFFNLLGNSLKFTQKGGTITVNFTEKDDIIETEIKDNGSGIEAEDIKKLFQKFGLIEGSYTTNQPVSGTGLGLYISRSIIELHQGKIWAASEGHGKGATFTFQLKKFTKENLEQFNHAVSNKKETADLVHTDI